MRTLSTVLLIVRPLALAACLCVILAGEDRSLSSGGTTRRVPEHAGPSRHHPGAWPPIDPDPFAEFSGGTSMDTPSLPFALLLRGVARQERVYGEFVPADGWPNGAHAHLGRLFCGAEQRRRGQRLVAVISHRLWRRRYGSNPAIVGRTLRINSKIVTVIGVLRPGDALLKPQADLWLPLTAAPLLVSAPRGGTQLGTTMAL